MTIEEFRSRYFYKDLKCKKCGKTFKRCFLKDTPQSVIDLYTDEDAPVFCDECWNNNELKELLKRKEIMEDFQITKLNYDADKGWFIKNQPDLSAVDEATKLSKKRLLIRLLKSLQNIKK